MPYFPYNVGNNVIAKIRITEAGGDYLGDKEAEFPDPQYIHAEPGDIGIIEYIDSDHEPTVRFKRTGTATVVGSHEIELDATIYSENFTGFEISFKLINDLPICRKGDKNCSCAKDITKNYQDELDTIEHKLSLEELSYDLSIYVSGKYVKYIATVWHTTKISQLSRKAIEDFFTKNRDYVQSVPKD